MRRFLGFGNNSDGFFYGGYFVQGSLGYTADDCGAVKEMRVKHREI